MKSRNVATKCAYEGTVLNPLAEELGVTKGRHESWHLADQMNWSHSHPYTLLVLITHSILKEIPFFPKGERFARVKWEYNEPGLGFQTKSRLSLDLNRKYFSPLSQAVADLIY